MMDPISSEYIRLSHAINRHVDGFIDAYFGPKELAEVEATEPKVILARIDSFRDRLRSWADDQRDDPHASRRANYLQIQARAMQTVARKIAGEPVSFREETRGCFDVDPQYTSEDIFESAMKELDALLPGSGPVNERLQSWKKRFEVSNDVGRAMIDRIADESRQRTRKLVDLPPNESCEFVLVSDKPWGGYNWYLGNGRSRVEINTDTPLRADRLRDLVCHEAYAGHHTEHACKEQRLYLERGWGEQAIQLLLAPECVISEGIARLAEEMTFGDEGDAWTAHELFPMAKIDCNLDQLRRIEKASQRLGKLGQNAALMLHEQGKSSDQVLQYFMRFGRSEAEARRSVRFVSSPIFRAYTFTYEAGKELLEQWMNQGDRAERFRVALTEQIYPSLVKEWAEQSGAG
jgi:hypothetical protein